MVKIRFQSILSGLAVASALLLGCDPDPIIVEPQANYFPLRVGDYRVFHVQETQITAYNIETLFEYDIKTVVVDSFENTTGRYSYLISRYKRNNNLEAWQALDTWTARADDREVVVTEGSTPFVRLSFPIKSGRTWNGNAYNSLETNEFCAANTFSSCDLYELTNVGEPFNVDLAGLFNNTLRVVQNDSPDLVTQYDVRIEIYAADIGLISKESTVLKYCSQGSCLGQQLVESGVKLKQALVEYGHD